jgi:WD40 repeat protein
VTEPPADGRGVDSTNGADCAPGTLEPRATAGDELLERLEQEYLDGIFHGGDVSSEEFARRHPEIAGELRRRLKLIEALHRAAPAAFGRAPEEPEHTTGPAAREGGYAATGPPRSIGRFNIVGVAGQGAFGMVLKAQDPALGRLVAIKVPHARFLPSAEERSRFLREARSAASLRHPHIVAVHEISEDEGFPYIVTDYIDGATLADSMSRSRRPPRAAAKLVAQVAEALATAHACHIVHRDIKPGNILIDRAGDPHITDFGLARIGDEHSTLTTEGQLLGTPAYMAPEQAAGKFDQLDGRCDVYSLGVVLYELITGELPFRGSPRMVIQQLLHDEPRPPRSLDDRIPRDLETICLKALVKEPGGRFQTSGDLADDLNRYLRGEPIHARRITRFERGWRWCRRNPAVAGLLAAVAALLVVIVGISVWGYFREARIRVQAERRRERLEELLGSLVAQADRHGSSESKRNETDRELYRLSIESADRSLRAGEAWMAQQVLERQRAAEGRADFRGWEWFHLLARAGGERVFQKHDLDASCDAISGRPDGERLALGSDTGDIIVWDVRDSTAARRWAARRQSGSPLAWSADGRQIASVRSGAAIDIWEADSGMRQSSIPVELGRVAAIAWNPLGDQLAIGGEAEDVLIVSAPGEARPAVDAGFVRLAGHLSGVTALAWNPEGTALVSATGDLVLREWVFSGGRPADVPPRRIFQYESGAESRTILSVAWSPDGAFVASAHADGTIRVWQPDNSGTWHVRRRLKTVGHTPHTLAWSPDGARLASTGSDQTVRLWDVDDALPLLALTDVHEPLAGLCWSGPRYRLTGMSRSSRVYQWEIGPIFPEEMRWPSWRQEAIAQAKEHDFAALRRNGELIGGWAVTVASESAAVRERLVALQSTAALFRRHHLLADALAAEEQLVRLDTSLLAADRLRVTRLVAASARRHDETVAELLAGNSREARRSDLERLLEQLFPYGAGEAPIPFITSGPNRIAPRWQTPQVVVELAEKSGELAELRNAWDSHADADGVSMLSLRAEASAAAGDAAALEVLLAQLASIDHPPAPPLWSEACILAPMRRRLTQVESGFDEFGVVSAAASRFIRKDRGEMRISIPAGAGELQRVGAVRRRPIHGDFEISTSFEIHHLPSPRRVAGIYLQLDLLEGGEMLHFSRVCSHDVGHELVACQTGITHERNFATKMWRFPVEGNSGRLILARRADVLYWLFAESASRPARLLHAQVVSTTDVAAVSLFVDYRQATTQDAIDVFCRELTIRSAP